VFRGGSRAQANAKTKIIAASEANPVLHRFVSHFAFIVVRRDFVADKPRWFVRSLNQAHWRTGICFKAQLVLKLWLAVRCKPAKA
jgi:hypothetical protein